MSCCSRGTHRSYCTPQTARRSQFTRLAFTERLQPDGIATSMDSRGCRRDKLLVEQLWRNVKYEQMYLQAYDTVSRSDRAAVRTPRIPGSPAQEIKNTFSGRQLGIALGPILPLALGHPAGPGCTRGTLLLVERRPIGAAGLQRHQFHPGSVLEKDG